MRYLWRLRRLVRYLRKQQDSSTNIYVVAGNTTGKHIGIVLINEYSNQQPKYSHDKRYVRRLLESCIKDGYIERDYQKFGKHDVESLTVSADKGELLLGFGGYIQILLDKYDKIYTLLAGGLLFSLLQAAYKLVTRIVEKL